MGLLLIAALLFVVLTSVFILLAFADAGDVETLVAPFADDGAVQRVGAIVPTVRFSYRGVPVSYRKTGSKQNVHDKMWVAVAGRHPQFLIDRESIFEGGRDLFVPLKLATPLPTVRVAAADAAETSGLLQGRVASKLAELTAGQSFRWVASVASDHARFVRLGIVRPRQHPQTVVALRRSWSGNRREVELRSDLDSLLEIATVVEAANSSHVETGSAASFVADRAAAMFGLIVVIIVVLVALIFAIGWMTGPR